ncbi:hypothetical protein SAMN05216229_108186 [Geopseudomonas sagittaria]|uniref:Uncharacterized protein n=1 Tax=Geopseudomonas sagittaria TaxID=1135990 RepID=A0A1I5ULR3_9GAMM|nr:hypothetical protein [Pseudomonas sagittaria]MCM2331486.1 hypothetical protein [Pseudomonas sagittaria]SFP95997.1 hypothetical protein SAMN05216229_108186 [Pseudomonas sagittaria]
MNIAALRERIDSALQHETEHGTLAAELAARIDGLHRAIRLPCADAPGTLLRFVRAYVDEVPELVEAAASVATEAGIDAQIKPVLRLAEEFFLNPPQVMEGHDGLEALLDEAYLAHRLVEEVNDRYIAHFGQPLIPLDTTVANLVAHQLIGEPFANQLDAAVHHASETLLDPQIFSSDSTSTYRAKLTSPQLNAAWQNWPCLSRQLGIELQLSQ